MDTDSSEGMHTVSHARKKNPSSTDANADALSLCGCLD